MREENEIWEEVVQERKQALPHILAILKIQYQGKTDGVVELSLVEPYEKELVKVKYASGSYSFVNIASDSIIAMAVDVIRGICY